MTITEARPRRPRYLSEQDSDPDRGFAGGEHERAENRGAVAACAIDDQPRDPALGSVPPGPLPALLMFTPTRYESRAVARFVVPLIAGGRTRRDPSVLQATLADRLANPPSWRGYLYQLYAASGWSSSPWLRQIRHRTLIVHGDDDPLVPLSNARNMVRMMPNARLHVVAGGGHLFLLDEPGAAASEIDSFLARR